MRPTINEIRQLGDFQPMYTWDMNFIQFPQALRNRPTRGDVNLRCISTGVPKKSDQNIEVNIRGHKVRQSGIGMYEGTLTLTFVDTIDQTIADFIYEWQQLLWEDGTGLAYPTKDVEATIAITRLDRENNPVRVFTLYGCKVEDRDHGGELGSDTNDVYKPTMTIGYAYFTEENLY